ncbi:MAG: thioredoxin family protein [Bacteroidota bacterium]
MKKHPGISLSIVGCLLFFTVQFTFSQEWKNDFSEALTIAQGQNKPIILVFSGSDWCAPCIRFKSKIFDSNDFLEYAEQHYVLYNADFPRKKKNMLAEDKMNVNKSLAERFNPKGYFPLVVILNEEEKVLGVTGFDSKKSIQEYIRLFNGFLQ